VKKNKSILTKYLSNKIRKSNSEKEVAVNENEESVKIYFVKQMVE